MADDDTEEPAQGRHQHGIRVYYNELVNKTILDKNVTDLLISRCVLTISDREEIIKKDTQPDQNRTLLNILLKRPYRTFQDLKDALREDPINAELVAKMTYSDGYEPMISNTVHESNIGKHVVKLQKNYQTIVKNIAVRPTITDQLVSSHALNHEEMQEVCASGLTHEESARRLIAKLVYKPAKAFNIFLRSLRKGNDCYKEIVEDIDKTVVSLDDIRRLQTGNL